ncbi:MAG TPA: Hsp33 family molecular chaperone HslO [Holophaga sp.]|nr:Hsp33 family molecular chaperone HslO [Holophaga sp.]
MLEAVRPARVLRALTADRHIRFTAMDASPLWDGVRRGHPHHEADACANLVELLSAALLLQSRTFFSERLQLALQGTGRIKALVADSWPEGDIRGILDLAQDGVDRPWIDGPGSFRVMRSNPRGQPYIGTLELLGGGIQAQLEAYLLQSEQVQSSATLWCDPGTGEAGALFVEPMPGCPRERLGKVVDAIEGLDVVPLWERDPGFLCRWINQGDGTEILSSTEIRYHCRCRKETLVEILRGFEAPKLDEIFHEGGPAEVCCDYCGRAYLIRREDLASGGDGNHAQP